MKRVTELDIKLVQHINLYFCWKLGWTHKDACAALVTVSSEQALHPTRSRHWYRSFEEGRSTLVDLQRNPKSKTGRSDDNIQAVKDVLAVDRSLTVAAIANQSGVHCSSVHRILKNDLHLTLRCAKFLPNFLTPRHIVEHFNHSKAMLQKVRATPSFLKKVITMDEAWVYQYDPELKRQASQWLSVQDEQPVHPKRTLSVKKSLLVAFFDHRGMVHFEFIRNGTVNTPTFIGILSRYRTAVRTCRPHLTRHLHMDNAPAHGSRDTRLHLLMTGTKVVDHPALSPDLAPSDYWLFPCLKKPLRGKRFPSLDALEVAVRQEIANIPAAEYRENILTKWPMCWAHCVHRNGDYFEGRK